MFVCLFVYSAVKIQKELSEKQKGREKKSKFELVNLKIRLSKGIV